MALTEEEKLKRKEERRQKKYNDTHKTINNIEYKLCNYCKEWFPCSEEYFYKVKNNLDGLRPDCITCTKMKTKKWQEENRERFLKSKETHRNENSEYYKEYKREWGKENRPIIRERIKDWQQNNPEKLKQYNQNRNLHKKHKITKKEWLACKEYFSNSCAYCGLPQEEHFRLYNGKLKNIDLHKEHVDDVGVNDLSNCVPSCQSCNSSKHTFDFVEWYMEYEYFNEERLQKIHTWLNKDYKKYIKQSNT